MEGFRFMKMAWKKFTISQSSQTELISF